MTETRAQFEIEKKLFQKSGIYAILIVLLLWIVKLIEILLDINFIEWGIRPRSQEGLAGILFSALIHGDNMHLYSNSVPLMVLCTGLFYYYRKASIWVFAFIYLIGGIAVWLFARDSWHIGASGIIYGLIAFIFFSGVTRKETPAIALALIVTFLYGSMVWGILPIQTGISWEAHLYGAMAGIFACIINYFVNPPQNKYDDWEEEYAAGYNEDGKFDYYIEE